MKYENLLFEVLEGIATITFNRPEKLNALNKKTIDELSDAIDRVSDEGEIRGAILTGYGERAFIAGADISELAVQTPIGGQRFALYGQKVFSKIENCRKLVVAAVNGFALGGGCELSLACHLRFASTKAKFGQPEVNLGIMPGYGGSQRLPRIVGKGMALEMIVSGEMITAERAYAIGLANAVIEPEKLLEETRNFLKKVFTKAPHAVASCIEAVNIGLEMPLDEALFLEATLFGILCSTEDMREGTKAFLEKRPPLFKGK